MISFLNYLWSYLTLLFAFAMKKNQMKNSCHSNVIASQQHCKLDFSVHNQFKKKISREIPWAISYHRKEDAASIANISLLSKLKESLCNV